MKYTPDERIRLGVVGLNFGAWMLEHEILATPGNEFIQLIALCDLDVAKTAAWSARLGVKGYHNLSALLEDPKVEAVGLFTGPVGRAMLIDQIISAGKDVITTKPFELDAGQAAWVLDKAARLGRVVHLNSPSPHIPADLGKIVQWIEQFDLGRPVAYRASTWCSYREKADNSWYDDPLLCPAAPIFRLGIYLINDVSWFFTGVQDVNVLQSRIFTQRPTVDNAQLSILYANGVIGNIFASFCINDRQFYRCSMEINFERGTVYRNNGPIEEGMAQNKIILELSAAAGDKQIIDHCEIDSSGPGYQWDVFYESVRGKMGMNGIVSNEKIVSAIHTIEMMRERIG